ncbi:iron transporter [Calderihabitans maritimus]|uniref:Ferrous iron transport protein n=1 Tax=Calderihabitans maritimus TaxID=1246530 RepID=A0A1Z5HR33_9FIRM|nr:iron transporter [Calderihabitans maritimus]GAW91993.1 ferrous iron transport protein [Calderihabitans maritimus]
MRRKWVYLLLVIALTVWVAGCSKADTTTSSNTPGSSKGQDTSSDNAGGFREYPVGDPQEVEGMEIAAVYFQPAAMEPEAQAGLKPEEADIHLEADIRALKENPNGFGFGEFIPYLTVHYELKNLDTGEERKGTFMPMNAADGPHYGANVKMLGAGKYRLKYIIESPVKQGLVLHSDSETGVEGRLWNKPIEVEWTFDYIPRKF